MKDEKLRESFSIHKESIWKDSSEMRTQFALLLEYLGLEITITPLVERKQIIRKVKKVKR
jgi:hypothetical protein